MNDQIVSALIGLAGACNNNGKTANTDAVVLDALCRCFGPADEVAVAEAVRQEKFAISPNCTTCEYPCGNTSDYDMEKFHQDAELGEVKLALTKETSALALRLRDRGCSELPEVIYDAISYLGYDLAKESYTQLIEQIQQTEV